MTLSPKEKQYAIVVAIVVAILALDQLVFEPYYTEYKDASTKVETTRANITKADTLFRTQTQKEKIWAAMLAQGLKTRPEDAQSQARGAVLQWAAGAGVNVSDTHSESPRQDGKFLVTNFKFTGVGSTRSISRWVNAIERGMVPPAGKDQLEQRIPLRIDDITITPRKPGTDELTAIVSFSTLCLLQDATPAPGDGNNNTHNGPVASAWGGR